MAEIKENAEEMKFDTEENTEELEYISEEMEFHEEETNAEVEETEMKSSAKNVKLTPFDELFYSGEMEFVQEVEIDKLISFRRHPFKIKDDGEMEKLIESIEEKGILIPAIARPVGDGYYELISGHRRKFACMKLGIDTMPVIIRRLDDDEAVIAMVDSNLQREHILPSEKAFSYKMKLEAIKHQGKRTDLTSGQVVQKLNGKNSVEIVADEAGESYKQIQRYIRLTKLIDKLLQMVDDNKLKFNVGVELSYLEPEKQQKVYELMEKLNTIPSLEQVKQFKKYSQEKKLHDAVIELLLSEKNEKSNNITLKKKDLKQYFPKNYSKKDIENVIFELLKQWQKQNEKAEM